MTPSRDLPMAELVTFLRARLVEDRDSAFHVHHNTCRTVAGGLYGCDCGWPARVLAETEAREQIIHGYERTGWVNFSPAQASTTLRLLAMPYAGRPGYRAEWERRP